MTDIALVWNDLNQGADIALNGPDLLTDSGLNTAITLSLFSDRRAAKDDVLPDGSSDRRGWWGNAFLENEGDQIGSRLWLLERSKITAETLRLVKDYAEESLAWLIADGVAKSVSVTVERRALNQVSMIILIVKPDGGAGAYDYVWSNLL